ncbi:hypothetical protein ACTXT7_003937 [Hymenolepis weldensis]
MSTEQSILAVRTEIQEAINRRYGAVDNGKLKIVQNTARQMMFGLYGRRQMSVRVLAEKILLGNLAQNYGNNAKLQDAIRDPPANCKFYTKEVHKAAFCLPKCYDDVKVELPTLIDPHLKLISYAHFSAEELKSSISPVRNLNSLARRLCTDGHGTREFCLSTAAPSKKTGLSGHELRPLLNA